MKLLHITPRAGTRLYSAIVKKQAEIRRSGRGTFSRVGAKSAKAARWSHIRYKGGLRLASISAEEVTVEIKSPDKGDESRLLSAFLGWLDRHFGKEVASVNIQYDPKAVKRRRKA